MRAWCLPPVEVWCAEIGRCSNQANHALQGEGGGECVEIGQRRSGDGTAEKIEGPSLSKRSAGLRELNLGRL